MQIVEKELKELKPYEKNPRKNDEAVDAVAASIRNFGFKVPIVIDENNIIVAGHTRYKAATKLKLKKVPCIVADDLTPEQVKAFRLADNKVGEIAEWDFELLDTELEEILKFDGLDFSMEDFGFELDEGEHDIEIIEDEVPEIDEDNPPISKLGDIWQLGQWVYCKKCGKKHWISEAEVIE
ncbi:MAG: ParB N-terminal domain-containing protein [Anaeroplasma bactoclasticum]|nr:ParB N-terminal domain-containing protein [Anaeroplasma bactoclasticum]